jgi:hypothetical protein
MERLAFKATDADMCCRGEQYQMRQKRRHEGELQMCKSGFHFCPQVGDVVRYYPLPTHRVFVVQHGPNFTVGAGPRRCAFRNRHRYVLDLPVQGLNE